MKKTGFLVRTLVAFIGLFSLLKIDVSASETDFLEVPEIRTEIVTPASDGTDETELPSLASCELGVGIYENGVGILYTTRATQQADEIGVKNMVLQEKTLTGWKDIPVKNHRTFNSYTYTGSVVYIKAEVGKTYRVYCTHYAIFDGVEYTLYNETDEIVFR